MSELELPWERQLKPRHVRQEQNLGKLPGGRQGVASGRYWRFKRDGGLHDFLIEARTTEAGRYCIERKEFQAIKDDALKTPPGLLPGMQIDIQDVSLIVMETQTFLEFQSELMELRKYVKTLDRNS